MSSVYPPEKYHDGRSPSAWTMSIGAMVAGFVIAIGAVLGPNWPTIFVGIGLLVIAGISAMVLSHRGLSNRS